MIEMTTEAKMKATEAVREIAERNNGIITPDLILEEARPKKSPLHRFFCWDNSKAADEYRRIQAAIDYCRNQRIFNIVLLGHQFGARWHSSCGATM